MSLARFGEWLLTKNGKKFSFGLASVISVGTVASKTLPNTIFIDQYANIIHLYKDGMSVPLQSELQKRFEKAMSLVGINQNEQKLFKPFAVFGFDTSNAGTSYSKFGAIIGIPVNFTYKNVDNIDKQLIKVNNDSVPWGLDEADKLLESLVLSEKAQLYAMAREIKTADSAKLILDTIYTTVAVVSCFMINNKLNTALNLLSKPRAVRFSLYALVTAFTGGNYFFCKDFTQVYYEQNVDKFLKETDPIFVEGGKEYYEKILQRNRALRKLLGKAGESYYSALGNENFFIRHKHVPLVHRKEFFEGQDFKLM